MTEQRITPRNLKAVLFCNVGTSEEFVRMFVMELRYILDGTTIEKKDEAKDAMFVIFHEGLLPAFEHLKSIRASVNQHMPDLNWKQLYEDFTRVLWHSYKDLMPRAVLLLSDLPPEN